eukprot:1158522-Pelagomonas_calceolata.AAC.6
MQAMTKQGHPGQQGFKENSMLLERKAISGDADTAACEAKSLLMQLIGALIDGRREVVVKANRQTHASYGAVACHTFAEDKGDPYIIRNPKIRS